MNPGPSPSTSTCGSEIRIAQLFELLNGPSTTRDSGAGALPPPASATDDAHMLLYDFETGFDLEGVEARDVAI